MKIQGPQFPPMTSLERARRKPAAGGVFDASSAEDLEDAQAAAATNQLAALESLLFLQEVDSVDENPQRGVTRGRQLLQDLEKLHRDLLFGQLSGSHLEKMHHYFQQNPSSSGDPRLDEIVMEIEQRVAIEWAKAERRSALAKNTVPS